VMCSFCFPEHAESKHLRHFFHLNFGSFKRIQPA
jgi:hypothetical protein